VTNWRAPRTLGAAAGREIDRCGATGPVRTPTDDRGTDRADRGGPLSRVTGPVVRAGSSGLSHGTGAGRGIVRTVDQVAADHQGCHVVTRRLVGDQHTHQVLEGVLKAGAGKRCRARGEDG